MLIFRSVLMYSVLVLGMRLLGKRQIGQLEPSELVVAMLIADLATEPMRNCAAPLRDALIPIGTVLALELLVALACLRSVTLRRLMWGKPVILIENGRILQENLRKNRITLDELSGHLRAKDVLDVSRVQYAIMETDGSLSVFPYPGEQPASAKDAGVKPEKQYLPVTIIADGRLYRENLGLAGKDEAWVSRVLEKKKATIPETYLLTVDAGGRIVFVPRGEKDNCEPTSY